MRHRAARLSAGTAGRNALFHVTKCLTGRGALFADLGTLGANVRVVLGAAQHEIGAHGADLGAVHHQAKVVRFDVRAADFQTMGGQVAQARRVARLTIVDALFHFGCRVVHKDSPPWD